MDWKFKHFQQMRVFTAPPEIVLEAARRYFAETLGWTVMETALGLSAEGSSFAHRAIVNLKTQSTTGGTTLSIELLVNRAGASGFMLFDVGGYYNIQIRKWLDGIEWFTSQKLTPHEEAQHTEQQQPHVAPSTSHKASACVFNGCLVFIVAGFGLYFLVTLVCALVGLITGNLYLIGRGDTTVVHGMWARIISVAILLFGVFVVLRVVKKRKPV